MIRTALLFLVFASLPKYTVAAPGCSLTNGGFQVATRSPQLICLVDQIYGQEGIIGYAPSGPLVDASAVTPLAIFGFFGHDNGLTPLFSINSEIGSQLSQLPAASPVTGVVFAFHPSLGVDTLSIQNFGPILSERAPTLGRHKLLVGISYEYFDFDRADGIHLRNFPVSFASGPDIPCNSFGAPSSPAACASDGTLFMGHDTITTQNRLDLRIHEVTAVALFGLTNRLDLSVAVPVLHVGLSMTSTATINSFERAPYESNPLADPLSCNNNPNPGIVGCLYQFSETTVTGERLLPITNSLLGHDKAIFTSSGSASGIGDVILRGKFQAIKREQLGLAIGIDLHCPTGAETQFLGSGAWGVRPFAALSYSGRIAPHGSVGYQMNGNSILAESVLDQKDHLANVLSYDAGVDAGINTRVSLSADFLGQTLFHAYKTEQTTFVDSTVGASNTSVDPVLNDTGNVARFNRIQLRLAIGAKFKLFEKLIASTDFLFSLNNAGLSSRPVPLVGITYRF